MTFIASVFDPLVAHPKQVRPTPISGYNCGGGDKPELFRVFARRSAEAISLFFLAAVEREATS
jgi:hypothetical protein